MRLATWNCRAGNLLKWNALEAAGVTIAVLSETTLANPVPDGTLLDRPLHWVAEGNPGKALVIASREPLERLPARAGQGRFTVAARNGSGLSVLGIWSCPESAGGGRSYEDEVIATLTAWRDELENGDMVVAGDFNVGYATGRVSPKPWVRRAQTLWTDLGLVSAYHSFYGREPGDTDEPTHFFTYNRDRGWHIDWILLHRSRIAALRSVTVGGFDDWTAPGAPARSDHVPVIVDLDW